MIHFITEILSSGQLAVVCRFNTGEERLVDIRKVLGDAIHTPFFPNYSIRISLTP
jgi:hypothetical protein